MARKISHLKVDLLKYVDRLQNSVNNDRVASAVGYTVRYRMLQLISRGISPILGYGRFPEYKGATRTKVARRGVKFLNREIRRINQSLKAGRISSSSSAVGRLRSRRDHLRTLKRVAGGKANTGYPYNTKQFKDGKKFLRPVNLFLTGDFLKALTYSINPGSNRKRIEIGWWDPKEAVKEKGHREGANTQPKRPTLPRPSEKWNQTIQLDIMKLLREAVTNAAKLHKGE